MHFSQIFEIQRYIYIFYKKYIEIPFKSILFVSLPQAVREIWSKKLFQATIVAFPVSKRYK